MLVSIVFGWFSVSFCFVFFVGLGLLFAVVVLSCWVLVWDCWLAGFPEVLLFVFAVLWVCLVVLYVVYSWCFVSLPDLRDYYFICDMISFFVELLLWT